MKSLIYQKELSLATPEGIQIGRQSVTEYKKITIRIVSEEIQTHIYILTSKKLTIPKEVKIGYCLEKLEWYDPAPLKYIKCPKYGHHKESCWGHPICRRCGKKKTDHMVDYSNKT